MERILNQHQQNQERSGKDSIRLTQFFLIHFGLFQKCYSYKRHISDTSPATFPHCDMMYEKRKPANLIFFVDLDGGVKVLPAQEEGGEYPVRETESSANQLLCLSHVIKFTGHTPKPLHRGTLPTITR